MKGIPGKLQKRFTGPFQVIETIGQQAYRLSLPETWKIHSEFHVSLLKKYNTAELQEDQPVSQDDVPEVEEPYYEIEKILRWRKVKRKNKIIKQYLVLWRGYPVEDAMWIEADQFSYLDNYKNTYETINPRRKKFEWCGHHSFEGGSSCDNYGN